MAEKVNNNNRFETLLKANEKIELTLRFENNITERIEIISKWLQTASQIWKVWHFKWLKVQILFSNSFDDFKDQVNSKLGGVTFETVVQTETRRRRISWNKWKKLQKIVLTGSERKPTRKKSTLQIIYRWNHWRLHHWLQCKTHTVYAKKNRRTIFCKPWKLHPKILFRKSEQNKKSKGEKVWRRNSNSKVSLLLNWLCLPRLKRNALKGNRCNEKHVKLERKRRWNSKFVDCISIQSMRGKTMK